MKWLFDLPSRCPLICNYFFAHLPYKLTKTARWQQCYQSQWTICAHNSVLPCHLCLSTRLGRLTWQCSLWSTWWWSMPRKLFLAICQVCFLNRFLSCHYKQFSIQHTVFPNTFTESSPKNTIPRTYNRRTILIMQNKMLLCISHYFCNLYFSLKTEKKLLLRLRHNTLVLEKIFLK